MKNRRVRIVLWVVGAVVLVCVLVSAGLYFFLPGKTRLLPVSEWGFGSSTLYLTACRPGSPGVVKAVRRTVRFGFVGWQREERVNPATLEADYTSCPAGPSAATPELISTKPLKVPFGVLNGGELAVGLEHGKTGAVTWRSKRLLLITSGSYFEIDNPNQLCGRVRIDSNTQALAFARLLTSPNTFFLWRSFRRADAKSGALGRDEVEIMSREQLTLSTCFGDTDLCRLHGMLTSGVDGIISTRRQMISLGFSPARVSRAANGYTINRWLLSRDYPGDRLRVLRVCETVESDGRYSRQILSEIVPPKRAGFWILSLEDTSPLGAERIAVPFTVQGGGMLAIALPLGAGSVEPSETNHRLYILHPDRSLRIDDPHQFRGLVKIGSPAQALALVRLLTDYWYVWGDYHKTSEEVEVMSKGGMVSSQDLLLPADLEPATVSETPYGYEVRRWLLSEEYASEKQRLLYLREVVKPDGQYAREVLREQKPPESKHWSFPRFE